MSNETRTLEELVGRAWHAVAAYERNTQEANVRNLTVFRDLLVAFSARVAVGDDPLLAMAYSQFSTLLFDTQVDSPKFVYVAAREFLAEWGRHKVQQESEAGKQQESTEDTRIPYSYMLMLVPVTAAEVDNAKERAGVYSKAEKLFRDEAKKLLDFAGMYRQLAAVEADRATQLGIARSTVERILTSRERATVTPQ